MLKSQMVLIMSVLLFSQLAYGDNYSLYFDGLDDGIVVPDDPTQNFGTQDFTVVGAFKTTDDSAIILTKGIGSGQEEPNNTSWYMIAIIDGKLGFEITDGYSAPGDYAAGYSTVNVNDGFWHQFAIVFDRDASGYIYLDGQLNSSHGIAEYSGDISPLVPIEIAMESDWMTEEKYHGLLDDIQLWSRTLSQGEIESLICFPPYGSEDNLTAYWSFNEGSGDLVHDSSPSGNNGTVYGATWCIDVPCELTEVQLPQTCCLALNYPNPFNPSTSINYGLDRPSQVEISIYNVNGRIVDVIQSGLVPAGYHSVDWTPDEQSSGIYFVEMKAGGFRDVIKVSFVK